MKPCFGYIRVSTQKQGLGVSLEAQVDAITAFASQHNLSIIEWFEERETAAKRGRPVFNRMLQQLKRGKAAGLVMHKIDRSARNLRDWALVSELPSAGIDLFFATESLDFRSRGGRLAANLQAVIAEDYIHNLREETIKGLTGRLKQGLYPFRAPIGYVDNGRGNPKTPCPIKGPLVRQAFELYASGEQSICSLMGELDRIGLRNLAGKPLSKHGVETILRNHFYTGLIVIRRTGSVFQGIHEPIVDAKLFQRVQDLKAGRAGKKVTRHNHLYRGMFRCELCSGPMSPERQKGRVYYRCQDPDCPTTTIREDRIDQTIHEALKQLEINEDEANQLERDWLAWIESERYDDQTRSIELRIAQIDARLERLMDLLIDGALSQHDHDRKKIQLQLDRQSLEEDLQKSAKKHLTTAAMQKFLELMKNLAELHILANANEKRLLAKNCFSNRTVAEKKLCLEPHNWLKTKDFSELSPLVTQNGPLLELLQRVQL